MTTCNTDESNTELLQHMNTDQLIQYALNVHISLDSSELIRELATRLQIMNYNKKVTLNGDIND